MLINRNNYEEFFLLYIDKELSPADTEAVEAFIAANPDLAAELNLLQQSIALPETKEFTHKENLLAQNGIIPSLMEKLMLHLDGEASAVDSLLVEQVVQKDKNAAAEWTILQQTKLDKADNIVFPYKQQLYKKSTGRVVAIRWWRMAAAAIVIGFGLFTGINFLKNNNTGHSVASVPATVTPGLKNETSIDPANKTTLNTAIQPANNTTQNTPLTAAARQPQQTKANPLPPSYTQPAQKNTDVLATAQQKQNTLPTTNASPLEKINNNASNNLDMASVTPVVTNNDIAKIEVVKSNTPAAIQTNTLAINTAFNTTDEDEDDGRYAVNDESDNKRSRSKIGGFLKKIKRTIERKTNTANSDDEIKIANLSFAVH
ncbi:MAG TPA: hypothetical protein PKC39_01225 [Ferruginibacter sp.]|nr:hypothetical protein [Ferruginibacter sp.]HMP19554.1 hypothetical protein [Ferruginibacter sp.]